MEFNTFGELYKSNAYAGCNLLKKFSVNVHTIGEYKELLEQYPKLPVIEDIDKDLFGCYVLKETNDAKDTISGIIIREIQAPDVLRRLEMDMIFHARRFCRCFPFSTIWQVVGRQV